MFIVLLDEPTLFVFDSLEEAQRTIEPPEAETDVRAVFDENAVPYTVRWITPNRRGRLGRIDFGVYEFVPSGLPTPARLLDLLNLHTDHVHPPEAAERLRRLRDALNAEGAGSVGRPRDDASAR